MDGIPLLLDCSRLDARNPLVTQWAVMALRNLTAGNPENQSVLAAVEGEGVPVNTLEEEFGIKVALEKTNEK